jgi:hypothetical protein
MLSGWERSSKSRTIKEAKSAKKLKHRRFDHQGLVEGKRREVASPEMGYRIWEENEDKY